LSHEKIHRFSRAAIPNPGEALLRFVRTDGIRILNVAGPRASKEPEVAAFTKLVLETML
jgi:hypothetical protein